MMENIRNISLDGIEKINSGGRADIYRISNEKILKVFHGNIDLDEINKMIINTKLVYETGIKVMKIYEVVKTTNGNLALICDYIKGDALAVKMHNKTNEFTKYVDEFVLLSKKLSKTIIDNSNLYYTNNLYSGKLNHLLGELTKEEIGVYEEAIENVPRLKTIVHGDYHLRNVVCSDKMELILIDIDDLSVGHPIWDLSSMAMAYNLMPKIKDDESLIGFSGLNKKESDLFWNYFNDKYYEELSKEEKEKRIETSITYAIVRNLRMASDLYLLEKFTLEYIKENINLLKEKLEQIKDVFDKWR